MFNYALNRWWTVCGGALACAVSIGVIGNSFGIFTNAIVNEFHWDRATATFGLSIQHACSGLSYIPLGAIMLRYGVRGPAAILTAICALSIMSLALVPDSPLMYYLLFTVVGFSSAAATAMPYSVAVTRWFDDSRGLALGVMVTGTGVGASVVPFLANYLLSHYGWRAGFVGLGALMALGALSALAFMVRMPMTQSHVGRSRGGDTAAAPSVVEIFTRLPNFWLIGLPISFLSFGVGGIMTNMVPIMTDRGVTTANAVGMLSIAGFASWASRIFVGALMDRFFAPGVAAGVMILSIIGESLILLAPGWVPITYFSAICIGFSLGAEADIVTFLVSRYFHPAIYSKVVGAVWLLFGWGYAAGISIASFSYAYTRSYQSALGLFVALSVVSTFSILRLGGYPFPNRQRALAIAEPGPVPVRAN